MATVCIWEHKRQHAFVHFTSLSSMCVCVSVCDPGVHAFMSVHIVAVLCCTGTTGETCLWFIFIIYCVLFWVGNMNRFKVVFTPFKCIVPLMQENYSNSLTKGSQARCRLCTGDIYPSSFCSSGSSLWLTFSCLIYLWRFSVLTDV